MPGGVGGGRRIVGRRRPVVPRLGVRHPEGCSKVIVAESLSRIVGKFGCGCKLAPPIQISNSSVVVSVKSGSLRVVPGCGLIGCIVPARLAAVGVIFMLNGSKSLGLRCAGLKG